jgi:hypothetical protein
MKAGHRGKEVSTRRVPSEEKRRHTDDELRQKIDRNGQQCRNAFILGFGEAIFNRENYCGQRHATHTKKMLAPFFIRILVWRAVRHAAI